MVKIKRITISFIMIFLFSGISYAAWVGDPAPSFSLPEFEKGGSIKIEDLKGKVVFIDFWASWCGPCKVELPALNEFYKKTDPDKVAFLAINIDNNDSNVKKFLDKHPVKVTVLRDAQSLVIKKFGGLAMPTSYVIGKDGVIRYVHLGFKEDDPAKWEEEIKKLLAE